LPRGGWEGQDRPIRSPDMARRGPNRASASAPGDAPENDRPSPQKTKGGPDQKGRGGSPAPREKSRMGQTAPHQGGKPNAQPPKTSHKRPNTPSRPPDPILRPTPALGPVASRQAKPRPGPGRLLPPSERIDGPGWEILARGYPWPQNIHNLSGGKGRLTPGPESQSKGLPGYWPPYANAPTYPPQAQAIAPRSIA
jgi:hypothetical protein